RFVCRPRRSARGSWRESPGFLLRRFLLWGTQGRANEADSTPTMTQQQLLGESVPADRSRAGRSGSIGLVLLLALLLVGAAAALIFVGRANAEPYIVALVAALAMAGVFLLFALAAGILRTSDRQAANPLLKSVVDGANEGILVTDARGHVLYANAAYLQLTAAVGPHDARPVERGFIGAPGGSA